MTHQKNLEKAKEIIDRFFDIYIEKRNYQHQQDFRMEVESLFSEALTTLEKEMVDKMAERIHKFYYKGISESDILTILRNLGRG